MLLEDPSLDHEYLPILGLPKYTLAAAKLILGTECKSLVDGCVSRFAHLHHVTLKPARANLYSIICSCLVPKPFPERVPSIWVPCS